MDKVILNPAGDPARASMSTAYEGGGGGFGDQLSNWNVSPTSANAALLPEYDNVNARSEDLARNDGYAKNGVQLHVDHIVGHQFKLVYKPNYRLLGLEREQVEEFVKDVEAAFTDYAEDNRCYFDSERKRTFTMLIREGVATHAKSGEITAVGDWFKKRGTPYKTSVKLVNYARISNPMQGNDTDKVRAGIKINKRGAMLGAYIRKHHPSDNVFGIYSDKWVYVPRETSWGREKFIQHFEPEGEGQSRGGNALLACLSKLKMLKKFQETTLQNAIINAMYAAVIESDLSSEEVFKALGSSGENGDSKMLTQFMNLKADYHKAANINLGGVKMPHLFPSETLKLQSVNAPSASLGEFEAGILRNIAKSLGVSFEQLSGDFSKTNYSSARASISESFRYFVGKREVIAKRFANSLFTLWFEEALQLGKIVLPTGARGDFYEMKSAWTRCNWIGAGKTEIDGLKGIKESIEKIKNGLSTYEIELGERGLDYVEVFDQQDREAADLESRGREAIWKQTQSDEKIEINPEIHTNE